VSMYALVDVFGDFRTKLVTVLFEIVDVVLLVGLWSGD